MRAITHSKPTIEKDDIRAVESVLKSKMVSKGGTVAKFENRFCSYMGGTRAIATSSGRDALMLALRGAGIGQGDEVIMPTYVCSSVMDSVHFAGANPVICDIGDDYCISVDAIQRKISDRTKAIIVVHIFGISAQVKEILAIARSRKILVIEDCAQAIGGQIDGRNVGSFGDLSFFSFQAIKLITCGEGGALLINNGRLLADFEKRGCIYSKMMTSMSDIEAALLINQFRKLEFFIKKRRSLAKRYIELLKSFSWADIPIKDLKKSVFYRFPIRIKKDFNFDLLKNRLEKRGIHIRRGVDCMLHYLSKNVSCPNADAIFKETVSLPIYPLLSVTNIGAVVKDLAREISNEQRG